MTSTERAPLGMAARESGAQGVGPPQFVQVNVTAARHTDGRYGWTWPVGQVHSYDRLTVIAAISDPLSGRLQDPAWVFSAPMFRRLAYLSRGQNGHDQYWIEASPTGHDRFARHRSTLGDVRSEEHTSELQSLAYLVCRLLLEKKKKTP